MTTFACVWTGSKYSHEYVTRLAEAVSRWYRLKHRFICLTDQSLENWGLVEYRDISSSGLKKWWPKMLLFSPLHRGNDRTIYLDLDTVIVGDLTPLVEWKGDFGICENFARIAGNLDWCRYGSCAMSFAPGWGQKVFDAFWTDRDNLIRTTRHGDQSVIETLLPNAPLLQTALPPGYFLNKRDLWRYPDAPPPGTAVVVFGGNERPDNARHKWIGKAWRGD